MSDERTRIAQRVIDVLTQNGLMQGTEDEIAREILQRDFFDRSGTGDLAKREVTDIFLEDPFAAKMLEDAHADAVTSDPGFRALLSRLIAPPPAQATAGSQRFAETSPVRQAEPAPAGLELAVVTTGEDGRVARPSIGVAQKPFTTEPPKKGAEVLMPGERYFVTGAAEDRPSFLEPRALESLPKARRNLELALKDMQRGRDGIDDRTMQEVRDAFIAISEGRMRPDGGSAEAGRTASNMICIFSEHPVNAQRWAERMVSANKGSGIDLRGGRVIVPMAKVRLESYRTYDEMRRPEKYIIPGTTLKSTPFGRYMDAEALLDELTAYLEQYPDVRARLAEERPELFGAEAIQRLKDRLGAIRMVRHASTKRERTEFLAEAVRDGILPNVPQYAREEGMEASSERQRIHGRRRYQRETEMWGTSREYPFDKDGGAMESFRDNMESMARDAEYAARFSDGELVSDVIDRFDRSMRLVDLHSAGLARDIDVLIDVFGTVGAIPEAEGRGKILTMLPSLKEMERMWRPGQVSARTPAAVLEGAGIRDNMPALQEPDRIARKRLHGKVGVIENYERLLTATVPPDVDYSAPESVAMVVASESMIGLEYQAKVARLLHAAHEFAMAGNRDGLMRLLGNDGENGLARLLGIRPFELITQLRRGSRGSDALIALHKVVGRDGMDAIGKLIKQGKRGGEGAGSVEDTMRNGGIGRIK